MEYGRFYFPSAILDRNTQKTNITKHKLPNMKIMQFITLATLGFGAACLVGCASMSKSKSTITQADFGKTADGKPVEIYTLRNAMGAEARILTYGGIVQKLTMPDKNGHFADIVLGFDNLQDYVDKSP